MINIRDIDDFNDYLQSVLSKTECDDLEFKSAAGGFPKSFWETYSAFANTDGGTIILGVGEKNNTLYLDGLTDQLIDKYKKDFWNNVNSRSTISCNLMKEDDVVVAEYKKFRFLLFFIPRASSEQRPVYRSYQPYEGTYKRNYEGDYKCTEGEVRRMFADADHAHPADSRILKNYTIEDLDSEAISKYRQLFKLSSPDHPWHVLSNTELLKKLGGYRKDRLTGEEGFTVAGMLMFGKSESITDVECCQNFFPDYQEHLTEDENIRWTNRICADGTWEANLFNFYQKVLPRLQSVLPKPFQLEDNIRRENTPAHIAVREALINLCIHADYSENASLVIKHNTKGFVFSNPGTMLVSKEQYYYGGESVCRNKSLQKMFAMLGVAEKAGSGTDKIMKGWKDANWKSPYIVEQLMPDKIVLYMPMESLISDVTKEKLTEKFGISASSFDSKVISILAIASEEGCVTNDRLHYTLEMHKSEISELLKLLVKRGLLVSEGYGRGMRYYLPKDNNHVLDIFDIRTHTNSASSNKANSASSNKANSASSNKANSASLNKNNSASSRKRRLKKEELRALIIRVCQDWISLDDIVEKTGKSSSYLRNNIVPRMLDDKTLEMLFPGTPKHPKQKYKVKD